MTSTNQKRVALTQRKPNIKSSYLGFLIHQNLKKRKWVKRNTANITEDLVSKKIRFTYLFSLGTNVSKKKKT